MVSTAFISIQISHTHPHSISLFLFLSQTLPLSLTLSLFISLSLSFSYGQFFIQRFFCSFKFSPLFTLTTSRFLLSFPGFVTPGLNILRIPKINHDFGTFFGDCIPIALVLYMESYSVARRLASTNSELHLLNASQELVANGVANLLGSVSSAFPVSGSYSRSALNNCKYTFIY